MAYDGRSSRDGFAGNAPNSRTNLAEYWKGRSARAVADSIGGALKQFGDSFQALGNAGRRHSPTSSAPTNDPSIPGNSPPGAARAVSTPIATGVSADPFVTPAGSFGPLTGSRDAPLTASGDEPIERWRWLAPFRASWWQRRPVFRHLISFGELLVERRALQIVVALTAALIAGFVLVNHQLVEPVLGRATPYAAAALLGIGAAGLVWVIGMAIRLIAYVLAFLMASLLALLVLGLMLYGSYLLLSHTGALH